MNVAAAPIASAPERIVTQRELIVSPRVFSAAALAATAALSLLLTACGSDEDGDAKPDDKIQGADKGEESPSPSAPEEAAGRPEIKLPADVKYEFEWSKTGDPDKDAVLRDGEGYIKAIDVAIAEQDPAHEAVGFYSEGEAAAEAERYAQLFVDEKSRTTGTYRFYGEQVEINDDGTATLIYCEDQGKAYNKSLETGKVAHTPVTKDSYLVYNTKLRKNDDGVWVTEQVVSDRGAAQCQP
ncbi:hypothetical protein O7599_15135 [Streptomyces sp. WMMC500]|uniref:hypothetical protein n=1 Tax=Streptomyces sp. WMMC500 TaxID=3015154 RepID=UPI00248C3AAB|nr:hypothetical protein [Streptomyces sp. WMMC500]WBB63770.1 hypothetical protein O7599_15135 [Streptomyces sp. WMMC500]